MTTLAQIWRHPVKGVGAERLEKVTLAENRPLPFDRAWAILTGEAEDTGAWQRCVNFARGCYGPELMAVTSATDQDRLTFSHPKLPDLSIAPATEGDKLVEWITPIYPPERPAPHTLVNAPAEGMADASFASVSILGMASLDALGERLQAQMDPRRFRGNLWLAGLAPFAELDMVGETVRIGTAELEIRERIERCRATEANPDTGIRDANTLQALRQGWGHVDFGVKAVVTKGGTIQKGDKVEVLS
ncbi:MOSC domain-containing protein [Actibacterium pelagium]|uniref:Molybdenum cofactor biosysynthesis protein n=1 Tax=Actibacterium pelagium TaxID=2029103 RepID=A0A917EHG6_9RHOB|nr:MOSC domain-containing protein [Actibacterium pelagium]GGE36724.1 molybdenum cofactor biosysynthesis protein [Actibacterium pelagium]